MLCPRCNTQNRENAKFCKVCGYSFTTEAAQVSAAVPPASPMEAEAPEATNAPQNGALTHVQSAETARPGETQEPPPGAASPVAAAQTAQSEQFDSSLPSPSPQPSSSSARPTQTESSGEEDISLAPTQILSPQEMMEYQARRWQHEAQHEQQESSASAVVSTASVEPPPSDVAQGTEPSQQARAEANHAADAQALGEIADTPTAMVSPTTSPTAGEPSQIPPPPPPDSLHPDVEVPPVSPYAEEAAAPPQSVSQPITPSQDAEIPQVVPAEQETPASVTEEKHEGEAATETPDNGSEVLAVGSVVVGRYEVTQVISEDEHEHVYQVVDHQGYQHCWNCGSEQNAEGDEFCIDCGAELLNAPYIMHVYSADSSAANQDAHVLQGTIINTFMEQGRTYVIEQQQAAQMAFPNGVHLLAASDSDAGNVRRGEPNEDSTLVLQLQRLHESQATPIGVFIVADGMGGHDNGQGASRIAINIIAERLLRDMLVPPLQTEKAGGLKASLSMLDEDSLIALFNGAIEDANNVLCQINQQDKTDMGSTITGFMIAGDHAYIINVGDSRTYMLREGTLYQLTNDHSLVGQLVAGGLIEPDDVYTHPQRSQIFRSLGDKLNVQIDDFKQQLLPGDILLSCCDGLWEMVRNPQITEILSNARDPQTACTQLIEAANANGGEDNVSAVVVFVH